MPPIFLISGASLGNLTREHPGAPKAKIFGTDPIANLNRSIFNAEITGGGREGGLSARLERPPVP